MLNGDDIRDQTTGPTVYELTYWLERMEQDVSRMVAEPESHEDVLRLQPYVRACRERLTRIQVMIGLLR